jgi:ParB family chromosome partitioning protein
MPGAVDRLVNIAGTRRFEHTAAQLREEQASATFALVKLVVADD